MQQLELRRHKIVWLSGGIELPESKPRLRHVWLQIRKRGTIVQLQKLLTWQH